MNYNFFPITDFLTLRYYRRRSTPMNRTKRTFSYGSNPGEVTITHREFVGTIWTTNEKEEDRTHCTRKMRGASGSEINFPQWVNPTNPLLFPWLSTLAHNWQQFRMNALAFEYKSTSGGTVSGENPLIGQILMAVDYNPQSSTLGVTKTSYLENFEYSMRGKPSTDFVYPIDCSDTQVNKYSTTNYTGDGGDRRFEKIGTMYCDVSGTSIQSGTGSPVKKGDLGKLFVTYSITLSKPQQKERPPSFLDDDSTLGQMMSAEWAPEVGGDYGYSDKFIWGTNASSGTKKLVKVEGSGLDNVNIILPQVGLSGQHPKIVIDEGTDAILVFTFIISGTAVAGAGVVWPTFSLNADNDEDIIEAFDFYESTDKMTFNNGTKAVGLHSFAVKVHNPNGPCSISYDADTEETTNELPTSATIYTISCSQYAVGLEVIS